MRPVEETAMPDKSESVGLDGELWTYLLGTHRYTSAPFQGLGHKSRDLELSVGST